LATSTPNVTATTIPTRTPVIVIATSTPVVVGAQLQATSTSTPGTPQAVGTQLSAAELATVSALQTQMAAQGGAGTPEATSTALPKTGFADEYGIPGLLGLAVILIAVIFLSRKLRTSAH
jgi:LPXTG-motif cell wall-anchored protein